MERQYEALYQQYVADISTADLNQLYLQLLGNILEMKTIAAKRFERKHILPLETVWSEATSWVTFVETIRDDWETREKIDPIQTLIGLVPKCFCTTGNIVISPASAENLREFNVMANFQTIARLEMEGDLQKNEYNKHCQLEVIRHVQPNFFRLILACAAKRIALLDNEKLSDNYKLNFEEVRPKHLVTIEEKFQVQVVRIGVLKELLQQNSIFRDHLKTVFYNNDSEMVDRYIKNGVEGLDLWSVAVARFRINGIEKQQIASKDQEVKCFKIWFSPKASGRSISPIASKELLLYFEYRQTLTSEKAKGNNVAALLLLDHYFPDCAGIFLRKLMAKKFQFSSVATGASHSPKVSLSGSRFFPEPQTVFADVVAHDRQRVDPPVVVSTGEIFSAAIREAFDVTTVFSGSDDKQALTDNLARFEIPECLNMRKLWWLSQAVDKHLCISAIRIDQNEGVFQSTDDFVARIIVSFTDDKGDLKHFYKDIRVTRLRPDVNPISEEEVQLRTNIAVFSALEGWCSSLQQLIASKLAKNEFAQAIARLNSEPQLIRSDSELSHAEGTQTFPEAELRRGLFGTAMIPDLKALEITTSRAIVPLRNLVQKDPHFQQQDGPALDELIRNIQQGADIDEALEKYLRNSTETEFTLSPVDLVQNPIEITVFDENTRQLLWSAKLVRPVNWTLEMLEMVCRRFKNLLSCRLIKKANFERISTIDNIRKVLNVTNN